MITLSLLKNPYFYVIVNSSSFIIELQEIQVFWETYLLQINPVCFVCVPHFSFQHFLILFYL